MFKLAAPLQLRIATPADREFFSRLYATTRDELKSLGLPPAQFAELMQSQQRIQEHGMRMTYPNAQEWMIYLQREDYVEIGRLISDFTDNDWRIVDIAILPEYRNQGWGQQVMRSVMNQASLTGGTVSLGVMHFNEAAKRLYQHLGFSVIKQDAIHAQMIWRSAAATTACTAA